MKNDFNLESINSLRYFKNDFVRISHKYILVASSTIKLRFCDQVVLIKNIPRNIWNLPEK